MLPARLNCVAYRYLGFRMNFFICAFFGFDVCVFSALKSVISSFVNIFFEISTIKIVRNYQQIILFDKAIWIHLNKF